MRTRQKTLTMMAALTAAVTMVPGVAQAGQAPEASSRAALPSLSAPELAAGSVQQVKELIAADLARALRAPEARDSLYRTLTVHREADLIEALAAAGPSGTAFTRIAREANERILALKGLNATADSMLRISFADPSHAEAVKRGVLPLIAATAEDHVGTVLAYDLDGGQKKLDITGVPAQPLLLVSLDGGELNRRGLTMVQHTIRAAGLESDIISNPSAELSGATKTVTRLEMIELKKDHEPWHKGGAEIYGLVLGQGKNGTARVDTVWMPYLDHDETWYHPKQQIIDWPNFRWNAVDILLMEEDDGMNYKALAKLLVKAIATKAGGPQYVPLIDAVLDAIPDQWWVDDTDYVDSLYSVTRTTTGWHPGAAHNANMYLEPVTVGTP